MSGTSLDGVDAVLADLSGQRPRILASSHVAFDDGLRATLLALNASGDNEIERAALAGNELARVYARAIEALNLPSHAAAGAVRALGCHGQTVRHRPKLGYTVQLGNASLLAELTGLTVVSDFRSRDVAAGGEGAPLVPAFHAAVFASAEEDRVALNLGGIANLTWLPRDGKVTGFDTGPANCLLDLWAARHLGTTHDEGGAWGALGKSDPSLLARMLAEPYFALAPPKSTGRDLFNARWLESMLRDGSDARAVQATLMELTAQTIAGAIAQHCEGARRVIVCGGGTRNEALVGRLAELLSPAAVASSALHGILPNLVEATAFAWLAQQALEGRPGNLPAVSGASGARILGAVRPGSGNDP